MSTATMFQLNLLGCRPQMESLISYQLGFEFFSSTGEPKCWIYYNSLNCFNMCMVSICVWFQYVYGFNMYELIWTHDFSIQYF